MKNILRTKIIFLFIIMFINNDLIYSQIYKVSEIEKEGLIYEIYSDGTWKKKDYDASAVEWIYIEGVPFKMGSPENEAFRDNDEIQRDVELSSFYISKFEIIFEQYDFFCKSTGRELPDDGGMGRGQKPVINISWHDANDFATWMNASLPTEAQWEYACRAGTTTPFNTGVHLITDESNYDGQFPYLIDKEDIFREQTLPVGSLKPNAFGLYDMHGNVWEWVKDAYDFYPELEEGIVEKDPFVEVGTIKVMRGGGWQSRAFECRSSHRISKYPYYSYKDVGFRIIKY